MGSFFDAYGLYVMAALLVLVGVGLFMVSQRSKGSNAPVMPRKPSGYTVPVEKKPEQEKPINDQ